MTSEYCPHPALVSEQLQQRTDNNLATPHGHHRRHHSAGAVSSGSGGLSLAASTANPSQLKCSTANKCAKTTSNGTAEVLGSSPEDTTFEAVLRRALPDRTGIPDVDVDFADDDEDDDDEDANDGDVDDVDDDEDDEDEEEVHNNTKDCVDCASVAVPPASNDLPDHLQHCFSRTAPHFSRQQLPTRYYSNNSNSNNNNNNTTNTNSTSTESCTGDGCDSGLSSAISSPSASTASSPLSTPTRLAPNFLHSHQKLTLSALAATSGGAAAAAVAATSVVCLPSTSSSQHQHQHQLQQQHQHQQQHQQHHHHHSSAPAGGCKKLQKLDPRFGPSPYRQLLPIALCILSFATVFSILIVYMDTTEIRHQQFRLKMSRDYELDSVAQDDPTLIAFLREIHMRKYPMQFLKSHDAAPHPHLNFSAHLDELAPEMAHYVADLVGGKLNGAVIQSLPGKLGQFMTAPWLSETLDWAGIIVEPEPRRYFTLRKQNAHRSRMQVVHACVSPKPHPKEVAIHSEESEVRINSLLDEETSWFNSRVKCFPLYTIMLACNRVEYDLLSLGVHGHELEILETLPFDKIKIEVISIHLPDDHEAACDYVETITKFLWGKSYKLQKKFGRNYFYQHMNTTSRTLKKDILLLKTGSSC